MFDFCYQFVTWTERFEEKNTAILIRDRIYIFFFGYNSIRIQSIRAKNLTEINSGKESRDTSPIDGHFFVIASIRVKTYIHGSLSYDRFVVVIYVIIIYTPKQKVEGKMFVSSCYYYWSEGMIFSIHFSYQILIWCQIYGCKNIKANRISDLNIFLVMMMIDKDFFYQRKEYRCFFIHKPKISNSFTLSV